MESKRKFAIVVAIAALILPAWSPTETSGAAELKATNPRPADGATGVTLPLLQWTAGTRAAWHNLYIGTNPQPGPAEFVGRQVFATTVYYHMAPLEPGTMYYWRIDEVEPDGITVHTGDVWSFTTLALTAGNPSPADGAIGVDPSVKLTWTPGSNAMAHDVYFGVNADMVAQGAGDTSKRVFEK